MCRIGPGRRLAFAGAMTADDWEHVIAGCKACVAEETGRPFPQDSMEQLWQAIRAVSASWMSSRTRIYRCLHSIPEDWGMAVTVQAMVFGNMGGNSASGVAFTRNPSTGDNALYGEFLVSAQGEDIVSGMRTPQNLTADGRSAANFGKPSFE